MTRKQRKQARRQKHKTKGNAKRIDSLAKRYATLLSKQPTDTSKWNRLGFCPTCKENFCFAYGGGVVWCDRCPWFPCLKITEPLEPLIIEQCKPCTWGKEDYANTSNLSTMSKADRMQPRRTGKKLLEMLA